MSRETIDEARLISLAVSAGIERFVVGALLVRDNKVLLLKRSSDDFMGGMFELPSGKVEPGESLLGALRREVKEESGLSIKRIEQYLGYFDYQSGSGKPTRQFNFSARPGEGNPRLNPQEHEAFIWAGQNDKFPVSPDVAELLNDFWIIK